MKLHYLKGTCSVGIHALLVEIGKPFEVSEAIRRGTPGHEKYAAINPKGKVPALSLDDGTVITEYPAVSLYLARTNPEKGLIGTDLMSEIRTLEMIDYLVSTVHMQGYTLVRRPDRFTPSEADHAAVQAIGRQIFSEGMGLAERELDGREWLFGSLGIADFALFYLEYWAVNNGDVEIGPNCRAHYERIAARPGITEVIRLQKS